MTVSFISSGKLIDDAVNGRAAYCIVDARTRQEFEAGHIPGARLIAWESWCERPPHDSPSLLHEPGYWGLLPDSISRDWARQLSEMGLGNDKRILVYGDGPFSWGSEGRIAWMLLYLGASEVSILDGGWRTWLASGGPVESEGRECEITTCRTPADFTIKTDSRRRVRLNELAPLFNQSQMPGQEQSQMQGQMPLLVDTRSRAEFQGEALDYYSRNGHLPGSILFPFDDLYDSEGRFITRERYLQLAPPEILSGRSLVAYCEVGVRASTFALLHEIYTGRPVPVYDGSLVEWAYHGDLPVLCS